MQQHRLSGCHFNAKKFIILLMLLLMHTPNILARCVTVEPEIFLQSIEERKVESQPVFREQFKLAGESSISFTSILLDPLSVQEREAIRVAIEQQDTTKKKKIGIGRSVLAPYCKVVDPSLYQWISLPKGGRIAVFTVKSPEAAALRVKIKIIHMPKEVEIRFYNPSNPKKLYGTYSLEQIRNQIVDNSFWSPVIEGDSIAIEIFLPNNINCDDLSIAIPQIQHLWSSVLNSCGERAFASIGESGYCNIDVSCTDWGGGLEERSVAKMVFTEGSDTYGCTGTMLSDKDPNTFIPYFLTAHHCISTQAAASSLITYWNFQKHSCFGPNPSTFIQRNGGAKLLSTGIATDYTLLRLYQNPPSGTAFAGWTTTPVAYGKEVVCIHHPNGDLKKINFGTVREFVDCTSGGDSFTCNSGNGGYISVGWDRGVIEPGSSGSALFNNQGYVVGTLKGGSSSCQEPYLSDIYGRFDRTYPLIEQWIGKIVPIAICDAEHLNLCSSSMDCQNTGGYWYDNQCNFNPQPPPPSPVSHNAAPSHALPVVIFPTGVTPGNNMVQVGTCNDIMIQPKLRVPFIDVGKTATLIMYIYMPGLNFGINIPSRSKVLTAETKIDLLPNAIDFSDSSGLNFYIYYGYVIGATIKYNAYSIVVGSSCNNAVPDCGSISDTSSCNTVAGCTWQEFPSPPSSCILDCLPYTSPTKCQNAFGGACKWNTLVASRGPLEGAIVTLDIQKVSMIPIFLN